MENNIAESIREMALRTVMHAVPDSLAAGQVPFAILNANDSVKSLENLLPNPTRKRGKLTFDALDSFVAYVVRHKVDEATVIFAAIGETSASFVAVIDHHESGKGQANWGEHRATYPCPASPEWKRWTAADKKQMSQGDFAQFLEDNLVDIVRPEGALILEVARSLEAKRNVNFRSAKRLDNGDQEFMYEEQTEARAGNGTLSVPSEFKLGLAPFANGEKYEVAARLRFRITEGVLCFWYELVRPHLVIKDACDGMMAKIKEETNLTPLLGKPE